MEDFPSLVNSSLIGQTALHVMHSLKLVKYKSAVIIKAVGRFWGNKHLGLDEKYRGLKAGTLRPGDALRDEQNA